MKRAANEAVVYVEEYEAGIPLLLAAHPIGCIHSVFQNGVNIRMGEHLLFIGTTKNGRLPFGIHLTLQDVQQVISAVNQQNEALWDEEKQLLTFVESTVSVSFELAVPYQGGIPQQTMSKEVLTENLLTFASVLLSEPRETGLSVDIGFFFNTYLENENEKTKVEQQLVKLVTVMSSDKEAEIENVLRYFLGRGLGLTPSGDDHLVGVLAIHTAADLLSQAFLTTLERLVRKERLTTDIGREYLLYALDGKFSSTVTGATSALTGRTDIYMLKPLLLELLDMGHSSGTDTVFGMLLGLLALRRKQEWQKK